MSDEEDNVDTEIDTEEEDDMNESEQETDDLDENPHKLSSRSFKQLNYYERTKLIGIRIAQLSSMNKYEPEYLSKRRIYDIKKKYGDGIIALSKIAEEELNRGLLPLAIRRLNGEIISQSNRDSK